MVFLVIIRNPQEADYKDSKPDVTLVTACNGSRRDE